MACIFKPILLGLAALVACIVSQPIGAQQRIDRGFEGTLRFFLRVGEALSLSRFGLRGTLTFFIGKRHFAFGNLAIEKPRSVRIAQQRSLDPRTIIAKAKGAQIDLDRRQAPAMNLGNLLLVACVGHEHFDEQFLPALGFKQHVGHDIAEPMLKPHLREPKDPRPVHAVCKRARPGNNLWQENIFLALKDLLRPDMRIGLRACPAAFAIAGMREVRGEDLALSGDQRRVAGRATAVAGEAALDIGDMNKLTVLALAED